MIRWQQTFCLNT